MKNLEKVLINQKSNFFYLNRGVKRTPIGTDVEIIECNNGIEADGKTIKGTMTYALRNKNGKYAGQLIAFSNDIEDLQLFAMEYNWNYKINPL